MRLIKLLFLSLSFVVFGQNSSNAQPLLSGYFVSQGFDPDAQAFITAAGITGATQQAALNQLVLDLKGEGSTTNNSDLWTSKLDAVYPFCPIDGSTANLTVYQWNLINPLDTDAAYRMTWVNTPSATVSGIQGNGTNAYGNTHFNLSVNGDKDNFGLTLSRITSAELGGTDVDFGASDGNITNLSIRNSNILAYRVASNTTSLGNTDASGVWTGTTRASTDNEVYKNGVSFVTSASATGTATNLDLFFLARNNSGTAQFFVAALYNFAVIHKGLTDNEAKDLYDAINTYNTALGR